jgi:hypothetical protein
MGHCEYFASALTLMLRSQGVPARMVIGYRPREFNDVGNYYVVRQRDAHAWVEAYLRPEEIPVGMANPEEQHAGGGWLRLDPTPADELENAMSQRDLLDTLDYARWLWSDYVLRLTEERQKRAFLGPLSLDRRISMANLTDAETWQQLAQRVTGTGVRDLLRGEFSWRGGLAAIFACVAAYLGYRLIRSLLSHLHHLLRRRLVIPRRRRATVAFYQRFESLVARIGLQRNNSQTQRQFATAASARLAASPHYVVAADIPHQIVDAFYRVRFGHQAPDEGQEAEIREKLRRLEKTLV